MTQQDRKGIIEETYDNVGIQLLEFTYYAEMLEKVGRKKEAEGLREIASAMENWLGDARL